MVLTCVLLMLPAITLMVDITVHVTQDMKEMVSIVQVSTLTNIAYYIIVQHICVFLSDNLYNNCVFLSDNLDNNY